MTTEARLQILFDLHLESPAAYDIFPIEQKAECLALLGDIGNVKDAGLFQFLQTQLESFRFVLFLPGNHKPYGSSWPEKKPKGEFVILDQARFDLTPYVTILGCTLFSHIVPEQNENVSFGMNDFYYVEEWSTDLHQQAHIADLDWLNAEVKNISSTEPDRRIVVLTHYRPCTKGLAVDPKHVNSPISSGFGTDLSKQLCWMSNNVRAWVFGHTHFNCDFRDVETEKRVLTNQRGYYFAQSEGFDAKKVLTM